MDLQTDSLIQKTIRRVFKDRTTITIAHRLDTIIFSDRILAMSQVSKGQPSLMGQVQGRQGRGWGRGGSSGFHHPARQLLAMLQCC